MPQLQPNRLRDSNDPIQELQWMLHHAFNPMVNGDSSDVVTSQWIPRVDIQEEDDRFLIQADIPGVDPKDIEVHMDKGMLTIKGERVQAKDEDNNRFSRSERQHGMFYRRFALPDSADPDGIQAAGKHGVLEITIPKRPAATPRRIQVS